jgi:hypothetical protein
MEQAESPSRSPARAERESLDKRRAVPGIEMFGKDCHYEEGVRVNGEMLDKPVASADAEDLFGEPNGVDRAANPERPVAHGGGLLIYLKHLGVLNVDEFRRTNTRGL